MKIKRTIAIMLVMVTLLGVLPFSAHATDWGQGDTLEDALSELKVGFATNQLDWLVLPNLGVVSFRYTYFQYKNERTGTIDEHPVYCIDPTKGGAKQIVDAIGSNSDGSDTATYIRGEKVGDAKYKAIMAAGFPQMRYTSLGLQSEEEGYYATKLALWMYIRGNNPDKLTINPKYGNSDPVALRVRDAAVDIYKRGTTSTITREPKLTLTAKPSATATLDANGEYYVQGVEVYASGWVGTSPEACGDVQLSWESQPPAGTIVLGSDGEDITSTLAVKMTNNNGWIGKVTIKYPASEIDAETFSPPTLKAKAIVPNDAIYVAYAEAGKTKYQRYLVASDPKIELTASFVSQLNIDPQTEDFPSESGLRIRKLQSGTNTPLDGAVFEIRDPDGKLIYSMATDASGIIDIPLYVTGNYTVTEVTPPEYHLLSANRTQSVTVKYGEVAEVTFTNDPYGTLRVVKRDASNGMPLGGAAVQIKHITTNTTQEMHTDSSGCAVFERLPVGAYEIVEITAPDGYELDSTVHTVNVVPLGEGETSYTLTNKALPGLRITKFDRQTMTPIEGVSFEVWRDGELFGTFVTDAWGEIELRDIPAGTYTAREVATVAPYVLDTTAQWIEIKAGQGYISDLYFFNLAKPGINLIKIDSETFTTLVNAKFLIKNVGGTFSKEYTTDENGEISLSELDPGAYIVEEITAPDGYLIDDAINPRGGERTIQINAGENAQFVFTNTLKPVLEVLKFDGTNYLPGATFRIAKIEDGSHYLDRITDINGKIRIEGLEPGIYSVKELQPPPGYLPNETEFHVELFPGRTSQLVVNNVRKPDLLIVKTDANTGLPIEGVTYTVKKVDSSTLETVSTDASGEAWMYALDEGVYQITEQSVPPTHLLDETPQLITLVGGRTGVARFQNYPRPKLQILKVDVITGKRLPNAEFRVSKVEGSTVSEYITDDSGEILIHNLDVAIYKAEEFMPPDGYIRYDESKQIQLEPGKTSVLKFDNIRKPTLIITKSNALTFEPIPNTTYKIEYEQTDGGVYPLGTFKTDENGQIVIKNAMPGWYIITETIPAPGFNPSANPVTRKYLAPGENAYTTATSGLSGDISGNNIVVASGADFLRGEEIINYPLNSIVIRKVDANTGKLLPGAAFEVRQVNENVSGSSGTLIGRYTTDNSGTIVITGLVPGGYIVTEVQSPPNYLLSENSTQQVWLKPDGTSIVETTFANWPYGGILITKVDAQTNKPLANARFRVTDSSGAVVGNSNGEYITDENGEILVPDVEPGSYVVTEIEAPQYYAVDTTPQTIKVGLDGGIYKVSFKNQPAGEIVIRKLDTVTKEPLEDAEFKVTDSTGAVVGTGNGIFRTDITGTIKITGLPKGSYVIEEITAPTGYILENKTQTVAVDNGKTYTIDVYNKKMSGLQIIKIDADSKQPLKGALFTVYRMDGGVVGTYETDSSGVIVLDALNPGWYKIAETKAPNGYLIDDTPKDVEITANQFVKLTFENKALASIQIKKTDEISGAPLSGAVFEVRHQDGAFVGEFTTDKTGSISIPAVQPGWYVIKETKAPTGYTLDSTAKTVEVKATVPTVVTFTNKPHSGIEIIKTDAVTHNPLTGATFVVERSNGEKIGTFKTDAAGKALVTGLTEGTYVVSETIAPDGYHLNETPKTVVVTSGKLTTVEFANKPHSGIQIIKLDATTKAPLMGAAFLIERDNGERIGTYTTDSAGKIIVSDLTEGTYIVSETIAPDGYILDAQPQTVIVKSGKLTTAEFTNKPMAGLQIIKLNSVTRQPIEGAEFAVAHINGERVAGPSGARTYKTNKSGIIALNELAPGWYTVSEVMAAPGYIADAAPQNVEIKWGKSVTLEITNTPMSGLLIIKTDEQTRKPLSGVKFEVKKANGEQVGIYTTDASGRIYINDIAAGKYVVVETAALDGYILDSTAHEVTVNDGRQAVLEVKNTQLAGLRLVKIDSITKKPIYNVEFMVMDANNKVVGTFYTDNNGVIDFAGILPEGRYTIRETRAAAGYYLDEIPKTVEFVSGKVTEIRWENVPKMAQIQILKKSGDDNEVNGLPAGSPLAGAVFEAYDYKTGNLVDRFVSGSDGRAVSAPLPLGRYIIREVQAPSWYKLSDKTLDVELEFTTQIVKLEYLNYSANTGVYIKKTGVAECMPGDTISYTVKTVQNTGTVPLTGFYWRDTLPVDAVRLSKIVTGTFNQSLKYKVMITTNKGDSRVIADNLSTTKNNVIDCSNASLGLKNDEYVTSVTFVFGTVKAGFAQVEQPQIFVRVLSTLSNGYQFSNKADVGGKYGSEWVVGNSTTLTTIFAKPQKLPRTGY